MNADYLELTDLTVSFDGFVAVDSVNLSVLPGDLRFLIGPNGAGKTTLIDAVSGLVKATGSARFGGHELVGQKVHRIARLGVGRTFQTAAVRAVTRRRSRRLSSTGCCIRCSSASAPC